MNDSSRLSILSNRARMTLYDDPYPHLVIENALDEAVFEQLQREYPDPAVVRDGREQQDTWFDYPACKAVGNNRISPLWQAFLRYHTSAEFFKEVIDIFGNAIRATLPGIEQKAGKKLEQMTTAMRQPGAADNVDNYRSDVSLESQFYINYSRQPRTVRGPHVDRPSELFAALLYFRHPDDDSQGSDLQVIRAREPEALYPDVHSIKVDHLPMEVAFDKVEVTHTAPYKANTLVLFINTPKSLHAVSPRSATDVPRRHVNFTADLFNYPEGGLFNVCYPMDKKLKKWLTEQPVIWRAAAMIDD